MTLSINEMQHIGIESHFFIVMLSVIMLSIVMLNVLMQSVKAALTLQKH